MIQNKNIDNDLYCCSNEFPSLLFYELCSELGIRKPFDEHTLIVHFITTNDISVSPRCLTNCRKKRISAVKLAYKGGIRGLSDPEVLKRVKYKWELYQAPERGRIHRIQEERWQPVSVSNISRIVLACFCKCCSLIGYSASYSFLDR